MGYGEDDRNLEVALACNNRSPGTVVYSLLSMRRDQQPSIAICLIKRVAENFTSSLSISSQFCHIARGLNSVFITSKTPSLLNEIKDVNVDPSNGLFAE
jgi:hypothetical protein